MPFNRLELNHLDTWVTGVYREDVETQEKVRQLILLAETVYPELRTSKDCADCHNWWVWEEIGRRIELNATTCELVNPLTNQPL